MAAPPSRVVIPTRVYVYIAAVVFGAVVLLPLSTFSPGTVHGLSAAVAAVTLGALVVIAGRHPVWIGPRRKANVSTAPEVAAVLLLPGPLAVFVLSAGALLSELRTHAPPAQRIFNASVAVVRGVAGVAVSAAVLRLTPAPVDQPLASLLAALAMFAGTTALVLGIAAIQLRENPLPRALAAQRDTVLADLALILTGIMAAYAAAHAIWTLPLLVAPALIAQRALRDGVALQAQTRLALEQLADIVDMRDHYTYEHSRRVAELARATARQLGLDATTVETITIAARLHDIGKIGIKSSVLLKPGPLDEREWSEMRTHPEVGARLIAQFPQFARGRELILAHHERFDGTGYPRRLAGEAIPLGARVIAVADAWDAMTSNRAYRRALDPSHVYAELERGRGTQFDPHVLDAFLAMLTARPDLAVFHREETQDVDLPVRQPARV